MLKCEYVADTHEIAEQKKHRTGSAGFWIRVGTRGAGKTTPACDGVRKPLPDMRSFLELMAGHLRSPWRSDERKILRYSNR